VLEPGDQKTLDLMSGNKPLKRQKMNASTSSVKHEEESKIPEEEIYSPETALRDYSDGNGSSIKAGKGEVYSIEMPDVIEEMKQ